MIPIHPWVLSMLAPAAVVGFACALYEKDMPASRWILIGIFLYLLPAWIFVDIAFVEWRAFTLRHMCRALSCPDVSYQTFINYSLLAGIEVTVLAMVGLLAGLRFWYLRRVYNW